MLTERSKFLDPDYRLDPKTDLFCCRCQKDIKPGSKYNYVFLVREGWNVLHPDSKAIADDEPIIGLRPIGSICSKILGMEWVWKNNERNTEGE